MKSIEAGNKLKTPSDIKRSDSIESQLWCPQLPKKRTELTFLSIEDAQDSEFSWFFGRIEEAINCFQDLLTFIFNTISVKQKVWITIQMPSFIEKVALHRRRKVHERMLVIWAALNGQLSCLHSFKIVWPMKPSYTSNEMT